MATPTTPAPMTRKSTAWSGGRYAYFRRSALAMSVEDQAGRDTASGAQKMEDEWSEKAARLSFTRARFLLDSYSIVHGDYLPNYTLQEKTVV